ncbi:hypothetical protein [Nonomuraea sp. NPDC049400]|uniref:hypothetical protein n=1 Tax=Nonomuraea sp. NPDC049400 TaxID=3364352 RepID=UPI0037AC5450
MTDKPTPLREMLARANMSPRQFGNAINSWLADRGQANHRIDPSSPHKWVKHGYRPYPPFPAVAAFVLSERLGTTITETDLWPQRRPATLTTTLTAVADLDAGTCVEEVLSALVALTTQSAGVQAEVTPASGADLAAAVLAGLHTSVRWKHPRRGGERVLPAQVQLISAHVTELRRLDDLHGGGALNLRYLTGELRNILDLTHAAACEEETIRRALLTIVSDLAQLVGWVHFDAHRYGAAERYILLSERAARALDDMGRTANAIGMLAYISAFAGHGHEALYIAQAAQECCTDDPVLRARIVGRIATAAAAAGDQAGFRRAAEQAKQLLDSATNMPAYLYYLEPEQLDAEAGQGLVVLGERLTTSRKRLLTEAVDLLAPISGEGARPHFPRSALVHGTFLAKAYLLLDEAELAVQAARAALSRLDEVQSLRGLDQLRQLRPLFIQHRHNRSVAEFLPHFDQAISQA